MFLICLCIALICLLVQQENLRDIHMRTVLVILYWAVVPCTLSCTSITCMESQIACETKYSGGQEGASVSNFLASSACDIATSSSESKPTWLRDEAHAVVVAFLWTRHRSPLSPPNALDLQVLAYPYHPSRAHTEEGQRPSPLAKCAQVDTPY